MSLRNRARTSLGSNATISVLQAVPLLFFLGWMLLAAGEVLAPWGAPAVPLAVGVVGGIMFGGEIGMLAGFLVGLAADLMSVLPVGSQAGAGALAGFLMGGLSSSLTMSRGVAPALLVLVTGLPYRLLVGLLSEVGGRPAAYVSLTDSVSLAPWDALAAILLYAGLSVWQASRR